MGTPLGAVSPPVAKMDVSCGGVAAAAAPVIVAAASVCVAGADADADAGAAAAVAISGLATAFTRDAAEEINPSKSF